MKHLRGFTKGLTGRLILSIIATVFIIHLIMLYLYLQENTKLKKSTDRQVVVQKILHIVNLMEDTPKPERTHVIDSVNEQLIHVTLTATAEFDTQFTTISYWEINKSLHQQALNSFSLSILLGPNEWLNINASIYRRAFIEQMLLLIIEIIIFLCIFISALSIYRYTKPLKQFKQATERLGVDIKTTSLNITGPKIIQETAEALNQMQKRIQELIQDRTQMLAAISHDLRTPITRLKLRIQFLDDPILATQLTQDLDEMEDMINDVLNFAKEDATARPSQKIDLISLLNTLCHDAQDLQHNVTFNTELHRVPFYGKPLLIKRALSNVINNATRYANRVQISIVTKFKAIIITVKDDGPGIPEDELIHVLTPFYRTEHSRSRDTGGTGLGLAVTRDIVKAHQGSITLSNIKPHGLRVDIRLPKMQEKLTPPS